MQKVGTLIAEWGGKDPEQLVRALLRLGTTVIFFHLFSYR